MSTQEIPSSSSPRVEASVAFTASKKSKRRTPAYRALNRAIKAARQISAVRAKALQLTPSQPIAQPECRDIVIYTADSLFASRLVHSDHSQKIVVILEEIRQRAQARAREEMRKAREEKRKRKAEKKLKKQQEEEERLAKQQEDEERAKEEKKRVEAAKQQAEANAEFISRSSAEIEEMTARVEDIFANKAASFESEL